MLIMMIQNAHASARIVRTIATLAALGCLCACSNIEKAPPAPQAIHAKEVIPLDVPEIMRGTIASETVLLGYDTPGSPGYQPIIARGYGLVVGLNGTGSRDIPTNVRAYMLNEIRKGGFGSRTY